jgi:hypothetical protein
MAYRPESNRRNAPHWEKNFTLGLIGCILGSVARGTPVCFQSQRKYFAVFARTIKNARLLALVLHGLIASGSLRQVQPERFGTQGQFRLEKDASENEGV